jgi:hypothetical protein
VRSHDLNRLLDEPGSCLPPSGIIFFAISPAKGFGISQAHSDDDLRPSLPIIATVRAPNWTFNETQSAVWR